MFSASFYGASCISYPLREAKSTTDISFKFRTRLSDALLLLAAGKTDYCMVNIPQSVSLIVQHSSSLIDLIYIQDTTEKWSVKIAYKSRRWRIRIFFSGRRFIERHKMAFRHNRQERSQSNN